MRNLTIMAIAAFLIACGGDESAGGAGKVVAGPETCSTYFSEVVAACRDSIHEGLDVSCSTIYMGGSVAGAQKSGKLFSDPKGKASNTDIANAVCASSLRSLRKKRSAASVGEKKQWGQQCTEYFGLLDKKCLAPAVTGNFPNGCTSTFSQVRMVMVSDTPEDLCQSFSALVR